MADLVYPYHVECTFASGTTATFDVTMTKAEAARLRKAIHDRDSIITIGNAADNAVVLDAGALDYCNITRTADTPVE